MNLVIDIGNTLVKFGVFSNNQLMTSGVINGRDFSKLKDVLVNHEIIHIVYAAVVEIPPELTSIFSNFSSVIRLDKNTSLPFQNKYLTPETLGNDRLANVCGAIALFPERNVLVIDVGTCLKFDMITSNSHYLGGGISPGMRMRFKGLNEHTAQLPLVSPQLDPLLIGRNTEESILSGVMNGMMSELNDINWQYRNLYPRLETLLTGGDSNFFLNHFRSRIFAAPHLTLIGLNHIVSNLHHEQK
ncbi:MAG: type III pantothenate kinase [Bacteroidetes bacterium]|nr:type III pantothenate kinase [Bacteroidota bacterium]